MTPQEKYIEDVKIRLEAAREKWDEHPLSNSAKTEVEILEQILNIEDNK